MDQLVETVANLIIGEPELNAGVDREVATDASRDAKEPGNCLFERDDITSRLAEIELPALVIHGTADLSIEMALAEQLCAGLPGCSGVVRIEGAPHASNLTHPAEANAALLEFLRGL